MKENGTKFRNDLHNVFVKSYYELTEQGWQVVALYKRIFLN